MRAPTTRQICVFTEHLQLFLNNSNFFFISLLYYQIATYTENDVQNALTDFRNGGALRTVSTYHGVPRTTLRGRLNSAQSYRDAHDDKQRLSTVQEEHLKR